MPVEDGSANSNERNSLSGYSTVCLPAVITNLLVVKVTVGLSASAKNVLSPVLPLTLTWLAAMAHALPKNRADARTSALMVVLIFIVLVFYEI